MDRVGDVVAYCSISLSLKYKEAGCDVVSPGPATILGSPLGGGILESSDVSK